VETTAIEATFYSRFAEFICALREAPARKTTEIEGRRLIADASDHEFLDALVVSYRAFPALLAWLATQRSLRSLTEATLNAANDRIFARQHGHASSEDLPLRRSVDDLTPREVDVLTCLADGLSNSQIAARLFITESTVKVHVHHILEKLGVENRLQAALKAESLLNP
jgi:DNA-binding NarL/FixJ family response regulator